MWRLELTPCKASSNGLDGKSAAQSRKGISTLANRTGQGQAERFNLEGGCPHHLKVLLSSKRHVLRITSQNACFA